MVMKYTIITLYPDAIRPYLDTSILGRAQKDGLIEIEIINLRDYGLGRHKQVDDTPYGGGPGMVLRPDVVVPAIEEIKEKFPAAVIVLLSPTGGQFNQGKAEKLSKVDHIVLVCGRFEGFDARIEKYCDEIVSVGPYVLAGGEIPALLIVEATARLILGVLGNEASPVDETFSDNTTEYPQYTKPPEYNGLKVPEILLGGHHQEIAKWRDDHRNNIP